jgi:hypothetical protein
VSTDQVERPTTGLVDTGVSLWPTRHQVRKVRAWRWYWYLSDETTGKVVAEGYSLIERWAVYRREVVANQIYSVRWDKHLKAGVGRG